MVWGEIGRETHLARASLVWPPSASSPGRAASACRRSWSSRRLWRGAGDSSCGLSRSPGWSPGPSRCGVPRRSCWSSAGSGGPRWSACVSSRHNDCWQRWSSGGGRPCAAATRQRAPLLRQRPPVPPRRSHPQSPLNPPRPDRPGPLCRRFSFPRRWAVWGPKTLFYIGRCCAVPSCFAVFCRRSGALVLWRSAWSFWWDVGVALHCGAAPGPIQWQLTAPSRGSATGSSNARVQWLTLCLFGPRAVQQCGVCEEGPTGVFARLEPGQPVGRLALRGRRPVESFVDLSCLELQLLPIQAQPHLQLTAPSSHSHNEQPRAHDPATLLLLSLATNLPQCTAELRDTQPNPGGHPTTPPTCLWHDRNMVSGGVSHRIAWHRGLRDTQETQADIGI